MGIVTFAVLLVIAGVAGYIGYYTVVGKTAKQWNNLLKQYYPDISDKYKL